MFAKGPMPGGTPKADAMQYLPEGTKCRYVYALHEYVVTLPDGKAVGFGRNAQHAWNAAESWGKQSELPSL